MRSLLGEEPQHKRPKITRESIARIQVVDSSEQSLPVLPINKREDEIQQLQALTLKLENAYKNAQTRNEALHIEYKTKFSDYDDIISQLSSDKKEAEARAIYHHKQAQDAMNSLALIKSDHSSVTERLRRKMDELESKNSRLSSDIISEQSGREKATLELQTKESEWTSRIHHLENCVKVLENQVEQQQANIAQGLERESDLTRKWMESDAQLKELNNAKFDTDAIVAFDRQIKLQDDTRKVEIENYKLKGELKHYKELYHNVEMLREEKYSLESRVRDMDKVMADNLRLDLENARLKMEKAEWAGYLEKTDGLDYETPQGIVYNLTKERYESRLASAQTTALRNELENRDKLLSSLESHMDELKKLNQDKDRIHRSDIFAMELLEKDKALLKKHVEMLENQYRLYDVEEENYMEGNYDIQKTQRIQQLEGLLKEYEQRLATQAQDIIKSQMNASYLSTVSVPPGPYMELASGRSIVEFMSNLSNNKRSWIENEKALQSEIDSQANTIKITKDQLELLQELIDRHEIRPKSPPPLSQDSVKQTSRILSLTSNPASTEYGIRKQQLEELRHENAVLLERLLQQQKSTIGGIDSMDLSGNDNEQPIGDEIEDAVTIPRCTLRNMEKRNQSLEQAVAQKDKRIIRLHQYFEKKADELNNIMASVFGYRVNSDDSKNVHLESIFVNSKDLSFQLTLLKNDQTVVKVLGRHKEKYLRTLQDVYDVYVVEQNCIPGFLGAATLDLYDRQKIDMADEGTARDDHAHNYLEQNPVIDSQGHELVQPEPMDQEDELDTDFVAEADDSGDNDYVECIPGDADGYDGDRLQYFVGQDEEDTEDYSPRIENKEIRHQEITGEATYEGYDDSMDSGDEGDNSGAVDENDNGINDGINYGDDEIDGSDVSSLDDRYNSGNIYQQYDNELDDDEDDEDDEERDGQYYDNGTHTSSGQYGQQQQIQHLNQGQENYPISLDDDDD